MMRFKLQKANQMWKAVLPLKLATHEESREATLDYSTSHFFIQTADIYPWVIVLVHINISCFDFYLLRGEGLTPINLDSLVAAVDPHHQLLNSHDDDTLYFTISDSTDQNNIIRLTHVDPTGTRSPRRSSIDVLPFIPRNYRDTDIFASFQYEVIVGIPSVELRRILLDPGIHGDSVSVIVTDKEVTFYTDDAQIILTAENEDCVIGGVTDIDAISMKLNLHFMDSVVEASLYSNAVWLFYSPKSPNMINCPVWPFANIKYYFVQDPWGWTEEHK